MNKKPTVFNTQRTQYQQPMFFGEKLAIVRYDRQVHPIFEQLIDKQLSFFWRPEEINCSTDIITYNKLSEHEAFVFVNNLQYQISMDSIQGRSPVSAFLPYTSLDEIELWTITWSMYEGIHSRSYTHILRSIIPHDMERKLYNKLMANKTLINNAQSISKYYDNLMSYIPTLYMDHVSEKLNYERKKALYLCLNAVNALEAIRFVATFAISFAFARKDYLTSCAKIIQLIARDEHLHHTGTNHMIRLISDGKDHDPMMYQISQTQDVKEEVEAIFARVNTEEKQWIDHIMQEHTSILGIEKKDLYGFIDYQTKQALKKLGIQSDLLDTNPFPWYNEYVRLSSLQVAPQESEVVSYLSGNLDTHISLNDLSSIEL